MPHLNRFNLVHDQVVEVVRARVHTFTISDAEDYELYARDEIQRWLESDIGQFVANHAVAQPEWHKIFDPRSMGYTYAITAHLTAKDYTFASLKWPHETST